MTSMPAIEIDVTTNDSSFSSQESILSNSLSPQGHVRHHSDENLNRFRSLSSKSNGSFGNESGIIGNGYLSVREEVKKRSNKVLMPIANLLADKPNSRPSKEDIMKSYSTAIEEYNKYTIARWLEYECVMRAIVCLMLERDYIQLEQFHRDHTGKYLDDMNTFMDHHMKAQICLNSAAMYKEMNFLRKHAFYARLSVLFELHSADGSQRTPADYRYVYPTLYKSLSGYGIRPTDQLHTISESFLGPAELQIKCLHELYTAANRAELPDAAIRHICHLLQVYYDFMEPPASMRLFDDLDSLVKVLPSTHSLNQALAVDEGKIILPAMQLTRFPMISSPSVLPLQPHLAPTLAKSKEMPSIFIYSPFAAKNENGLLWVVDCPGEVEVEVKNCRDIELVVRDLCLLADGVKFESVPARLILPPSESQNEPTSRIKLIGVPRAAGDLFITGYSCQVFGLHNVCRFQTSANKANRIKVKVVPPLAQVRLECSLPRAPIEEKNSEPSSEATVYSGQRFEHTITIVNDSDVYVRYVGLQVRQPTVAGGPPLISIDEDSGIENDDVAETTGDLLGCTLGPKSSREIKFQIFGIDPTSTADDLSEEEKVLESVTPLASAAIAATTPETESSADMDLIPYTGRLLTCDFIVRYQSEVITEDDEQFYERKSSLPIAITIVPAVTVSAWHVLPGDTPFSRYIVVDVTNSTDHDAELMYTENRRMNVLPKETCRVPLLSPCCSEVAGGAFQLAKMRGSYMMQKMEIERLRQILEAHVSRHLDIKWAVPSLKVEGYVPVGCLLSSVSLLKQLVLPAISMDFVVNDTPYVSEHDVAVALGQVVQIKAVIISSLEDPFDGFLSLDCEQEISHQMGSVNVAQHMLFLNNKKIPFRVTKSEENQENLEKCEVEFDVIFRVEGNFRVRPLITPSAEQPPLLPEDMFATPIAFSVATKLV
ncbi:unnamed protein product [Caenorhabditis auriculariae]|uniref:Uncharacterized protein n=1 Tax=Caenorhabditis auriculariae TaxID=2777116 RepID=A0A8S1GXA0_9PELO|nr:unnamed protein product [Caenorhabditis auriculariae]